MIEMRQVELFMLKCAVIERDVRNFMDQHTDRTASSEEVSFIDSMQNYVRQFDIQNRKNAARMSQYYRVFYLLENDIRRLIVEILEEAHGQSWWDTCVTPEIKAEVERNRKKEDETGISARSEHFIDYTTFGQLGDIITQNWRDFAGIMSNQRAVTRVMAQLNMLRGNIAHCGVLAEDEADRLSLAIKDWFRILEGPR